MNIEALVSRLREVAQQQLPLPASGRTAHRHHFLTQLGREDLSLARLAEAHFDAIAILAEAGRTSQPGALYGVWAAEAPGAALSINETAEGLLLNGTKMFCSGAGLVDRALITIAAPDPYLVDVDLRSHPACIEIDSSVWKASAFALTSTATLAFSDLPLSREAILHERNWYLARPGFWHGACGPAACWAGGAIGLVDYARSRSRSDPHTLAHLGAMHALQWQMQSCLDAAGHEIDAAPANVEAARLRALTLRHLIEQAATDILRRFARAYGPHPLAFDDQISRRYQELDIYLRQCHAERDLGSLGEGIFKQQGA